MSDEVEISLDGTLSDIIVPETVDGCPIFDKTPSIAVAAGVCPVPVEWRLRLNGKNVRLSLPGESVSASASASSPYEVVVRARICDTTRYDIEVMGTVVDHDTGLVRFDLPCDLLGSPGIYMLDIALRQAAAPKSVKLIDNALLSVEPSAFQANSDSRLGPPTLNEIRTMLRDTVSENSLLEAVEFSATDIYQAILMPIRQWNEQSPHLRNYVYNCRNFPYRMHWAKGAAGMLMRAAANHYVRNKMQAQAPGFSSDEKNKDRAYLEMSQIYTMEWTNFIINKKNELNGRQFSGYTSSPYSERGTSRAPGNWQERIS